MDKVKIGSTTSESVDCNAAKQTSDLVVTSKIRDPSDPSQAQVSRSKYSLKKDDITLLNPNKAPQLNFYKKLWPNLKVEQLRQALQIVQPEYIEGLDEKARKDYNAFRGWGHSDMMLTLQDWLVAKYDLEAGRVGKWVGICKEEITKLNQGLDKWQNDCQRWERGSSGGVEHVRDHWDGDLLKKDHQADFLFAKVQNEKELERIKTVKFEPPNRDEFFGKPWKPPCYRNKTGEDIGLEPAPPWCKFPEFTKPGPLKCFQGLIQDGKLDFDTGIISGRLR